MRVRIAAAVIAAAALPFAAGCGSSDTTQTDTPTRAAAAGDAGSSSGPFAPGIQDDLANAPSVPQCRPDTSLGSASRTRGKSEGGYNDDWTNTSPDDEEICGHFYNYMLTWTPAPGSGDSAAARKFAAAGPKAGKGALQWVSPNPLKAVGGAWTDGNGQWMWGPRCTNASEPRAKDGYDYRYCNKPENGWGFAENVEMSYWDQNFTSNAAYAYLQQKAADVSFGVLYFRMYNNGGSSDGKPGNCDATQSNAKLYLSCGAMNTSDITNAPENADDTDYDRMSFGFYVQNFPVAIRVGNDLPDSRLDIRSVTPGKARTSERSSTLGDGESITANATPDALWWAGYRERTGSTITIVGKLASTTSPPATDPWVNATVTITVKFPDPADDKTRTTGDTAGATCKINHTQASGEQAQCLVNKYVGGGPSDPGIADISISK